MVDIQEIIRQLLANGTPQQLTPEQLDAMRRAGSNDISNFSPGQVWEGGDAGGMVSNPGLDQYQIKLDDKTLALYDQAGNFIGEDARNQQTPTDLWKKGIATALAMYGGAQFLKGYMPGMEGAAGGMNISGLESVRGFPQIGTGMGGSTGAIASEGIGTLAGSLPGTLPAAVPSITSTVAPLSMAEFMTAMVPSALTLGQTASGLSTGMDALNPSFWDKTTDFLSDPGNLLKTIGTVGSIAEGLKDDPADPNANFTQSTTKTLEPALKNAFFGADGQGGALKGLTDWAAANPTGQNQTMIDAQNGMRGLLTDPRLMQGYFNMGGVGLGLLNSGIAPNPWMPKGGG